MAKQEQLRNLTLSLTINELGQITRTQVTSTANVISSRVESSVREVIRAMPQWTPGRFNWQPASMDGVAIEEQWVIYISRKQGFLTIYLPPS